MFGQNMVVGKNTKGLTTKENPIIGEPDTNFRIDIKIHSVFIIELIEFYDQYCESIKNKMDTVYICYDTGFYWNGDEDNKVYSNIYYLQKREPNGLDHNFMQWLKTKYK